ncbi:hypothetical protein BDF20DRAFT_857229 [Mycotypha africana]|uniref:uncharacterized protein n=1 Tax=Mycotypha africana TaxID=64632 RepID=UPI0023003E03|nr:uncharacterized protein BDF20DRAFT_857229 [Mycotypha africana]KAI8983965.1 hypothetical protein BDF20DRAFT_857229 [Mycotypha africana]
MKVLFVSCLAFTALAGFTVAVEFPNDLYYHHHPNEFNGATNKLQNYNGQNLQPPVSSRFKEPPKKRPVNRINFSEPVSKLKYNEDGSIDWSNKLADAGKDSGVSAQNYRPPSQPLSVDDSDDASQNWMPSSPANNAGASQSMAAPVAVAYSPERQLTDGDPYQNNNGDAHYGNQVGQPVSANDFQQESGQSASSRPKSDDNAAVNKIAASLDQGHEEPIMGFMNGVHLASAAASPLRLATDASAGSTDGYIRGMGSYYDLETLHASCGISAKNSDMVVAVNSKDLGDVKGKENPHCGKQVDIIGASGKTIRVTVIGECRSCTPGGLDMSPEAFKELGDFSHGAIPVKWKFID